MSRKEVVQIWLHHQNVPDYPEIDTWSVDELKRCYGLDTQDAHQLSMAVKENRPDAPWTSTYGLKDTDAVRFLQYVQESVHQGHDGYTDEDKFVIDLFLSDIAFGLSVE